MAPEFGLNDISYFSFLKQYDRKTQYSASDIVYCVTSILECPRKIVKSKEQQSAGAATEKEEEKGKEELPDLNSEEILKENFWAAYDALNDTELEIIRRGIELAVEMQTAIVNQGTSLIEKKNIYPAQELRYAIIYNDNLQEVKYFQYPLALQKLALFVMEAYKEAKKGAQEKPLVLCVLNSKTNSFLVVGVTGTHGMSEVPRKYYLCAISA